MKHTEGVLSLGLLNRADERGKCEQIRKQVLLMVGGGLLTGYVVTTGV